MLLRLAWNKKECSRWGSVFSHLSTLPARRDLAGCCHASHGWLCLLQPIADLPWGERTPVLMVTVLDDPDAVERAFAVGATYITKPIHWAVRHRASSAPTIPALKQLEVANRESG